MNVDLRQKLSVLENLKVELEQQLDGYQQANGVLLSEKVQLEKNVTSLEFAVASSSALLEELNLELGRLKNHISSLEDENILKDEEIATWKNIATSKENENANLEWLTAALEALYKCEADSAFDSIPLPYKSKFDDISVKLSYLKEQLDLAQKAKIELESGKKNSDLH